METIHGNADANGSLDKSEPYMQETYAQRRIRVNQQLACAAAKDIKPVVNQSGVEPLPVKRMPGNGSFA